MDNHKLDQQGQMPLLDGQGLQDTSENMQNNSSAHSNYNNISSYYKTDLFFTKDVNEKLFSSNQGTKPEMIDYDDNSFVHTDMIGVIKASWKYTKSQLPKNRKQNFIGCSTIALIVFITSFCVLFSQNSGSLIYMMTSNKIGDMDFKFQSIKPIGMNQHDMYIDETSENIYDKNPFDMPTVLMSAEKTIQNG